MFLTCLCVTHRNGPLLFFFFLIYLLIYSPLAAAGTHCRAQAPPHPSRGEWGPLYAAVRGPLRDCGGLSRCGAWAPGTRASAVVAHRL